jgi:hypothetical protein
MVMQRAARVLVAVAVVAGILTYLRDPAWLIGETSGLRQWEHPAGNPRYRWSTGHASFFVPADIGAFEIPVSTLMVPGDDAPMLVSVSVDDELVARAVLTDASWTRIQVVLPPPGGRRVRRIDLRTNITRGDFLGVRVGELILPPRLARSVEHQRAYPVS